jgi:hypothetical protein
VRILEDLCGFSTGLADFWTVVRIFSKPCGFAHTFFVQILLFSKSESLEFQQFRLLEHQEDGLPAIFESAQLTENPHRSSEINTGLREST